MWRAVLWPPCHIHRMRFAFTHLHYRYAWFTTVLCIIQYTTHWTYLSTTCVLEPPQSTPKIGSLSHHVADGSDGKCARRKLAAGRRRRQRGGGHQRSSQPVWIGIMHAWCLIRRHGDDQSRSHRHIGTLLACGDKGWVGPPVGNRAHGHPHLCSSHLETWWPSLTNVILGTTEMIRVVASESTPPGCETLHFTVASISIVQHRSTWTGNWIVKPLICLCLLGAAHPIVPDTIHFGGCECEFDGVGVHYIEVRGHCSVRDRLRHDLSFNNVARIRNRSHCQLVYEWMV